MSTAVRVQIEVDPATQDLWRLAETDDTGLLEQTLARGADINASNSEGVTALMKAAYNGRVKMVRALIDHGAELNATRTDGFTALLLAAFFGRTSVVKILVERGADLGSATRFGTSAEMWATARSFYEIARFLKQARSSALQLGAIPTSPANEPGEESPDTQTVSADPSQPVDLELTVETPRVTFTDQLTSPDQAEDPGTGHRSEHVSAAVPVVRTLKDPPEIWDLVHEERVAFDPGWAFVTRVTSSKTNLMLLTLAVILISGVCTFAVLRLRDDRGRSDAAVKAHEANGTNQIHPAAQASALASAAAGVSQAPNRPTSPLPDDPASAGKAVPNSIQPRVIVNNISARTAPNAGTAAPLSRNKIVKAASDQQNSASKPLPAPSDSEAGASGTRVRSETPRITVPKPDTIDWKSSGEPASAKRQSNTTLSTQLIAPAATSSGSKAKVIQWP